MRAAHGTRCAFYFDLFILFCNIARNSRIFMLQCMLVCRILECGHSFGTDCLKSALGRQNSIKCVLCDKLHVINDATVESVPSNTYLRELLEQLPAHVLNAAISGGAATRACGIAVSPVLLARCRNCCLIVC